MARDGNKLNPLKLAKSKNKNAHTGGLKSIADFARAHPDVAYSKADNVNYFDGMNLLRSSLLGGFGYAPFLSVIPPIASKFLASPLYQNAATSKMLNYPLEKFGLFMNNPYSLGIQSGSAQRFLSPSELEY
jgi:hypothetical protein